MSTRCLTTLHSFHFRSDQAPWPSGGIPLAPTSKAHPMLGFGVPSFGISLIWPSFDTIFGYMVYTTYHSKYLNDSICICKSTLFVELYTARRYLFKLRCILYFNAGYSSIYFSTILVWSDLVSILW